ncbi:MAG: transcription-repair coupling factor, partial [Actinobacteria bacterium]|nr:transcription-repair coupling factor [Actinomycetota bacterium]
MVVDPARVFDRVRDLIKEEAELAAALAPTWGEKAPPAGEHPALFLDLEEKLEWRRHLRMPSTPTRPEDPALATGSAGVTPGDPESVARGLGRMIAGGSVVVVAMDGTPAADRVSQALTESGLALARVDRLITPISAVIPVGIHRGFVLTEPAVAVLGEQEIAGRRRAHRRTTTSPPTGLRHYQDLTEGDHVVHSVHGIGRFEGLVSRTMVGIERDYLVIGYAAGDRLYVPVDQLASVRRYTGGETPRVSRMGGRDWTEQKDRVRKAVAAVAAEVVTLHRLRAAAEGHRFGPDTPWQTEMEATFPYEETPDQLSSVADVKADMEEAGPMDRLIFGDVGFGKTEVAIRAAFKA